MPCSKVSLAFGNALISAALSPSSDQARVPLNVANTAAMSSVRPLLMLTSILPYADCACVNWCHVWLEPLASAEYRNRQAVCDHLQSLPFRRGAEIPLGTPSSLS